MHARVTVSQIKPDKIDEAVALYRDSVVPTAKQQRGFKALLNLSDRTTGKGLSIVLWETEADMKAGEASGYYQQQLAKFKDLFATPPVKEHYEVAVQEWPENAGVAGMESPAGVGASVGR